MESDPSGLSRSEAARARARREEGAHYQELAEREAAEAERTWQQSGMGIVDYVRSRAEEGSPEFDLDWETMREIARDREAGRFSAGGDSAKNGAARDGKMAVAKLTKADYKQKRPQGTNELSLPRRKDPGLARGMDHGRAVGAVRLSLEAASILPNTSITVKRVYDNLVDIVRSIETGMPVMGMGKPVTERNFIKSLFNAGINTQTAEKNIRNKFAGESSGYLSSDGRTVRVSTHPTEAECFLRNKTDNNISFVIRRPSVLKEMTPNDKANVLEIVFNRNSLRNNPEDMARIVHDIARFVATGEYNDTLGAAKYNYSGSKEFIADTMRSLIGDAEMREDAKTAKEIRKEAKRRGIELVGNLGKMAVGGRIAAESLGKTKEYDRAERFSAGGGSAKNGAARDGEMKETVFNGPRASSEGSSDGVPDSGHDASPLRLRRTSGETRTIVPNDGKKVKARIRRFKNNDIVIEVGKDRPIGAIMKSLCKKLELRQKGSYNSHYGIFDTPAGKVAFRLSTHKAVGENFRQDEARRNTSVVIETFDIGNGDTTVPYEEFVYPKDVFDANRKEIVAAIMNGVDTMIDTGRFVDSTGLATYTENKGANFKRWFADSKIVDAEGKPLVMYHGSTWDPLAEKSGMAVFKTGQNETGAGAHFGTEQAARERAEGNRNWKIGKYYLSIKNPLEIADTGYWTPGDIVAEVRKTIKDFPWLDDWNAIKTELQKRGYDGLKYKNVVEDEGSTSYVAFEPTQIKSATDNIGTFDPANPDIRMSAGRDGGIDPGVFVFDPSAKIVAMGETEQNAGGLAAGIEKKEALRPWTKKMSPADLAKPIAFDAADMVMFWRAVSGSVRNPHVQKGERIAGRKDATLIPNRPIFAIILCI